MKRIFVFVLSLLIAALLVVSCAKPIADNVEPSDSYSDSGSLKNDNTQDIEDSDQVKETDGNENGGGDENENSDIKEENKDTRKKVTFGSYPQTKVTDAALKATLTSKAGTLPTKANAQKWTSYKYYHKYKENDVDKAERDFMWYIDITEGGEKYRGVYFTAYRPDYVLRSTSEGGSYQDDNMYLINTVYWFKYEPISWTVLDEDSTLGASLILCDMILDSMQFDYNSLDSTPTYNNDYAESSIRKWLNSTFIETAFGAEEQAKIISTTVDNSVLSTGHQVNSNACANTADKVFLLSYAEAVNDRYGLELSEARVKQNTDYALAQGARSEKNGGGEWWLRSPAPDPIIVNFTVRGVTSAGKVDSYINANYTYRGVVPALRVIL